MRRWLVRIGWVCFGLAVLLFLGTILLRQYFHGRGLAYKVSNEYTNPYIRGKLLIEDIRWGPTDLLFGFGDLRVTAHNVRVVDPDGRQVVYVPKLKTSMNLWALLKPWGHTDLLFSDVEVKPTFWDLALDRKPWALIRKTVDERGLQTIGIVETFRLKENFMDAASTEPGRNIEVDDIRARNVDLVLDFPGWYTKIKDASTDGGEQTQLRYVGRDPNVIGFAFGTDPMSAARAELSVAQNEHRYGHPQARFVQFGMHSVVTKELRSPHATTGHLFKYDLTATLDEGSKLHARGDISDIFESVMGVALKVDITDAGRLLSRLSDSKLGGENASLSAHVVGDNIMVPQIDVVAKHLEFAAPKIHYDLLDASVNLKTSHGDLRKVVARAGGGRAQASGTINMTDWSAMGHLNITEPVDIAKLGVHIPLNVRRQLGGSKLVGNSDVSLGKSGFVVSNSKLRLGNAGLFGRIRYGYDDLVHAHDFLIVLDGVNATLDGQANLENKQLDLKVRLQAQRLDPWLARLGLPRGAATSLSGTATIGGTLAQPTIPYAEITAHGVPGTGDVEAKLGYNGRDFKVRDLSAEPLGGSLTGRALLRLDGKEPRILHATVSGQGFELARVPGWDRFVVGTMQVHGEFEGPLSAPAGELSADANQLALSGYALGTASTLVDFHERGVSIRKLLIGRASTGSLSVVGDVGYDGSLDLTFGVNALRLQSLPGIANNNRLNLAGSATMTGQVSGTINAPTPEGNLALADLLFRKAKLGNGSVRITPLPGGRVGFKGLLLNGQIDVDGQVSMFPPWDMKAKLLLNQIEVEKLLPEMKDTIGAKAKVSGEVEIAMGKTLRVDADLSRVEVVLPGQDSRGRPVPVRVTNTSNVRLSYDGQTARLKAPAQFVGPKGQLTVSGWVGPERIKVDVEGELELALLEFFTGRYFDRTAGNARVALAISGSRFDPTLNGTVAVDKAAFRPRGQDTDVLVPGGLLRMKKDLVELEHLYIEIDGAPLTVSGKLTLDKLRPKDVELLVSGRLAAKSVALLAGRHIAGAEGSAEIEVTMTGSALNPNINGELRFDREFELNPRGLRHDIVFAMGSVRFSNHSLALNELKGRVDSSNMTLHGNPGQCQAGFCTAVRLYEWTPIDIFVNLDMNGVTHRRPGVLQVDINTRNLQLTGDMDELQLRGDIGIINGRYVQQFELLDYIRPTRIVETVEPIWAGIPLLENLRLNLNVTSKGDFVVKNNLANVRLEGEVSVTGTPVVPRLDGRIAVKAGGTLTGTPLGISQTFKIEDDGSITFEESKRIPDETPEIDLVAHTLFKDTDGEEHKVKLSYFGTLGRGEFDLSTDTGHGKAATINLLVTGRTDANELIRRADSGTRSLDQSLSVEGNPIDEVVKKYVGSMISSLIEAPLKASLNLDCVVAEPGTASWRLTLCKNVGPARIEGQLEQGLAGGSRKRIGISAKPTEAFSLDLYGQTETPADETRERESKVRVQLHWHFVFD